MPSGLSRFWRRNLRRSRLAVWLGAGLRAGSAEDACSLRRGCPSERLGARIRARGTQDAGALPQGRQRCWAGAPVRRA